MVRQLLFTTLAFLVAAVSSPAIAREPNWVPLGQRTVDFSADKDDIVVGSDEGFYSSLRLKVLRNDVYLQKLVVVFGNGSSQTVNANTVIQKGTSKSFDLVGKVRGIQRVQLIYTSRPGAAGKADVVLYGDRADGVRAAARPRGPDETTILDRQTYDLRSDRVVFDVDIKDGKFGQIRFRAVDESVTLQNVQIVYGDGEYQNINVFDRFGAGEWSVPIDLSGSRRFLREIIIEKRPNFRPGRGTIELLGIERPAAPPPPPQFEVIDGQSYDRRADQVVFRLDPRRGPLSQIRFRSTDDFILLQNVQIVFSNGETQTINAIDRLGPGEETQPIDVSGDRRFVREVVVYKRPSWRPGTARLELLGTRSNEPPPPQFEVVDRQSYDRRADQVVFRVDPRRNALAQIKFRSADDYILLQNVQIVFNNGETQNINAIDRLGPGEETQPVDVSGDRRTVREVVVYKRPSWRPGTARLELLGMERRFGPPGGGYGAGPPPPSVGPGADIPRGWVLFGAQSVGFAADRDVIPVGAEVGVFDRIAFKVRQNDIFLKEITIVYGNGDRDRVSVQSVIKANSQTAPIQLKGGDRFIKQIEFDYRSNPDRRERAVVEVYGDYAQTWYGDRGRGRNYNSGWLLLGSQLAHMFSTDQDAFYVGERFGRLRAIRLTVRRHDVRVTGMHIVYGNGETEDVPVFAELLDGQSSPQLDIRGRGRTIERVEVRYRTRFNFDGQGLVELWGLY